MEAINTKKLVINCDGTSFLITSKFKLETTAAIDSEAPKVLISNHPDFKNEITCPDNSFYQNHLIKTENEDSQNISDNSSFQINGTKELELEVPVEENSLDLLDKRLIKLVECDICKNTMQKRSIFQHMTTHFPPSELHKCPLCDNRFKTAAYLRKHLKKVHASAKPYKCEMCDQTFSQPLYVKSHMQTHTGEKPFKCTICHKGFVKDKNLRQHRERVHEKSKPYKCEICDRRFFLQVYVKTHMLTHTGENPFKCTICEEQFKSKLNLIDHEKSVHEILKRYKCSVCDFKASVPSAVIKHMRSHTKEKPYTCKFCHERFTYTNKLREHIKIIHDNVKPVKCEICHREYLRPNALKNHMKTNHLSEKPFKCTICSKRFVYKSDLASHEKIVHEKLKPYKCDVCDSTFSASSSLVYHMRTHTGEKPYKCKLCDGCFKTSSHLNSHVRSVHENLRLHKCEICGHGFNQPGHLRSHVAKVH